jgi:hypothetical protein
MTDWVFTVLMGGPQPSTGGTLDVSSFHVGKKKDGKSVQPSLPTFFTEYYGILHTVC